MRGAVPGRGRRQSAAPTRRSQRRPDRCATSLSPHPPSTPSLTSSLIYAAERGRKKARQTDRAPTLQHRCWPFFFPASGLCLPAFHSRLSIPFQRLGMLRRVDGLAEEQCGDSLPPTKTQSTESPQSKSHHLSCRVLSILSHYSSVLGRGLVLLIRRTWSPGTRVRRALSIWLVGCR